MADPDFTTIPGINGAPLKSLKINTGKKNNKGGIFGGIATSGGWNFGAPQRQLGSLAELIEQQAVNQKRQAEAKAMAENPALGNPLLALQEQLFGATNGINVPSTPIEELRRMAEQQVGLQFDPMMDALRNEMDQKIDRGGRSQKQAREMYGALSKDYLSQLPELTQQFAAEDQAVNARYDQAQQQMASGYQQGAAEQDALMKQLGIQAAAPDATQQSRDDQAYFQNQMELSQQQDASAVNEQQMAQMDYQRNLGNTAKMAGQNLASDIGMQLEDYLTGANSQMTALQGQRGAALSALVSQMQQADAERVTKERQQEFENIMKLYDFQLAVQKQLGEQNPLAGGQFGAEGTLTTGLPGAQNFLASQYPDQPILASNLMEQINDVLANKQVTDGKFILEPGNEALGKAPKYSDVGQEMMMDLLRKEFEKEGDRYNTGNINSTLAALQAYLGKLR